jgi:hypothetical protein
MEKTIKKQYPSQINSKTISARIPVQDYVAFLEYSLKNGISLNDWLLMKIYQDTNKEILSNKDTNKEILSNKDENTKTISFINGYKNSFENNYCSRYIFPFTYGNTKFRNPDELLDFFMYEFEGNSNIKKPDLLDAKIQIQMIANKKLSRKKCLDFMQELGELLKEIEE